MTRDDVALCCASTGGRLVQNMSRRDKSIVPPVEIIGRFLLGPRVAGNNFIVSAARARRLREVRTLRALRDIAHRALVAHSRRLQRQIKRRDG